MTININELRQLVQAATPGPWVATTVVTSIGVCHKVGPFPGKTTEHPPRHACLYADYESADNPADREIYANASFIAAANPAAVSELLDRLEAAEKERDWHAERCEDAMNECDALRSKIETAENEVRRMKQTIEAQQRAYRGMVKDYQAAANKIAAMEQQEPVFWWRQCSDGTYEGPIHNNSLERVRKQSGAWSPLYALPGAKGE